MNTTGGTGTTTGTTYSYRASLDNVQHGPETIRIALDSYHHALAQQLHSSIGPGTTHLYQLDTLGNVLVQLTYNQADAAPKQLLSFNLVNKSTKGYARPLGGGATANITQYTGTDKTLLSLRWLLKPVEAGLLLSCESEHWQCHAARRHHRRRPAAGRPGDDPGSPGHQQPGPYLPALERGAHGCRRLLPPQKPGLGQITCAR